MTSESWAASAETNPANVREQYESAPPNMRRALDVVRDVSPQRLTYEEVEVQLDWPRGRLRSVIGGWRSRAGTEYTRPYRICHPDRSPSGEWEIWMDRSQADALR